MIYNRLTAKFVMWFEDRSRTNRGYCVATADSPDGVFDTARCGISMPGKGRIGDYFLFVDDDLQAYHIRTGFDIVALKEDYITPAKHVSSFHTKRKAEAPVMVKRQGLGGVIRANRKFE